MLPNIFRGNLLSVYPAAVHSVFVCNKPTCSNMDSTSIETPAMSPLDTEQQNLLLKEPLQPANPKRLRVSVIGWPNSGKSTLINALTNTNLLPMSSKIDTTTHNTLAILTSGDTQIEFQDSPGIHNKRKSKRHVGSYQHARQPGVCVQSSDLSMVIADLSSRTISQGKLQPEILLHLLRHREVPTILVLNKVDRLTNKLDVLRTMSSVTAGYVDGAPCSPIKSKQLQPISVPGLKTRVLKTLEEIETVDDPTEISLAAEREGLALKQLRQCKGWPHFKEVFVVSALRNIQVDYLKEYLISKARPGPWKYHKNLITDLSPYQVAKDTIRSALLENLSEEIPYATEVFISDWYVRAGHLIIDVELRCQKKSHVKYCDTLKKTLEFASRRRLAGIFEMDVTVHMTPYLSR